MSVPSIDIRAVRPEENRDREQIWTIFREVVSTGTTYAYPSDTTREKAVRLWIEEPSACYVAAIRLWKEMAFEIVGTLPKAFDYAEEGLVNAHVMYRLL